MVIRDLSREDKPLDVPENTVVIAENTPSTDLPNESEPVPSLTPISFNLQSA
jgi:hypothetical protein